MNYKIVNLDQKTIVGISAITSNADPKMGAVSVNFGKNYIKVV